MRVNIALLTVTDTRTLKDDKSGAILTNKISEANHNLVDRKICKDNKKDIKKIIKEWLKKKNIDVIPFSGLAVDFAIKVNADFILRGLRAGIDFEVEFEMAHMWRNLNPDIDIVCMMSSLENQFVYSSRIKEVAQLGADISKLVPANVLKAMREKLQV